MKKIFIFVFFGITFIGNSQETTPKDALRYAVDDLNGTARFRAMSGAFGAIGGDLSAINVNPAGSTSFKFNTFSASLTSFNKKNSATYFGTSSDDCDSKLDINQIGAAFVFNNTNDAHKWKKLSLVVNYENSNNLDDHLYTRGVNPSNSIGNYFLNASQNVDFNDITTFSYDQLFFNEQQAYLGYNSYLLDYNSTTNEFVSNVPTGGNYYQDNYIFSEGYNGKLTGNFAAVYDDFLSLGINLNMHFVDYTKSTSIFESNQNTSTNPINVNSILFENDLYTYGRGFSFNLGAIAKVTNEMRLGLAYESPTWYSLYDEFSQRLIVESTETSGTYTEVVDPNLIILYPNYRVKSPSKWTGSFAYVFGTKGLLSVDVISKDFTETSFSPKNDNLYNDLNNYMSSNLKRTISYNIGGEYKIQRLSLRAGYRFEESPYKVDFTMGDLIGYSAGLGYNFGNSRLDASYSNTHRNYNSEFVSSGMNDTARINNKNNNVTLSYTVNF